MSIVKLGRVSAALPPIGGSFPIVTNKKGRITAKVQYHFQLQQLTDELVGLDRLQAVFKLL